ncbi:hypothetical protein IW140_002769 [Coemansia sp. RSA 1813]|nr:hypothetical protein EV178_003649 [Coemansia sp. RSA 1646]KAJ1766234.1 hypothetical protein LPJ74_005980 [Coemansia sp. RSA 1843]KAJ2088368.1 hypothetical protein IW138_004244 [Coemansia sp. RSA 986]KAJ2213808.1 hypothetical protein EV179_003507 [Coemansia sp. RSA 487]KAJ2569881.1 hypothetical protein IW140_002769 [Coemansia sp. RSA 1813]
MNNVGAHNTEAAQTVATVLASVGLGISGVTMILCLWLCIQRKELLRMTIYRVILAIQILMVLRSIISLIGPHVNAKASASCRVYVFFNLVLSITPLNLSVFAILYFQAVLLHNIPLHKRWPRIMVALATTVLSVVPQLFVLFIPAHVAGMHTFCQYYETPGKRHFIFEWLVFYIWVTLTAIVGGYSIITMVIAIIHRSQQACGQMAHTASTTEAASSNGEDIMSSDNSIQNVVVAVVKETRKRRRRSSNLVVAKTLSSIIWFPIAPIVTLGFNTVYSIIWYKTQTQSYEVFIIDRVLQFLSVPLMAMTFYLSPPARRALRRYVSDRKRKNSVDTLHTSGSQPCMFDDSKIRDFCKAMHPEHHQIASENGHERQQQQLESNRHHSGTLDVATPESVSTLYDDYFDDSD